MHKQRGVSLIELMIGITISLILLAGVITLFVNISSSGWTVVKSTRLNNELRSTLSFITRELEKAGYSNVWDPTNQRLRTDLMRVYALDPATDLMDDVAGSCNISTDLDTSTTARDTCDCVLYRYDLDNDGLGGISSVNYGDDLATLVASDIDSDNEHFGFMFDAANGTVDIKTNTSTHNADCADATWEALTSDDLEITELSFQVEAFDSFNDGATGTGPAGEPGYLPGGEIINDENDDGDCNDTDDSCLDRRKLNIVLEGRLRSDTSVTMRFESQVKLMNDRYIHTP